MASLSHCRKSGCRTIQFIGRDKKRRSIRLGKVSKRQAEYVLHRVEMLILAMKVGGEVSSDVEAWLSSIDKTLLERLIAAGLTHRRSISRLGEFLAYYLNERSDLKPGTRTIWKQAQGDLIEFFGEAKPLAAISEGDAEAWQRQLSQRLSSATVAKRCKLARQFFNAACKLRLINNNPFSGLKIASMTNPQRGFYISRELTQSVIMSCPNAEWRLIVALCRFAGLRCPSEVVRLRWDDIDFKASRMTVHSPKTERHEGKASRTVPIFRELRPYLDAVRKTAVRTGFVVTRHNNPSQIYRKKLLSILSDAKIEPWPKLFVNLRASAATDLIERFPAHVANAWMGHCEAIATKHYRQVTEEHFKQAVQKAVQPMLPKHPRTSPLSLSGSLEPEDWRDVKRIEQVLRSILMTPRGFEQFEDSLGIVSMLRKRLAKSGALSATAREIASLSEQSRLALLLLMEF